MEIGHIRECALVDRIQGEGLYIRDRNNSDAPAEALAFGDKELSVLDPDIGACHSPTRFSILTNDNVHIGTLAMYNYTGGQVELGIRIWDRLYWGKGYGSEAVALLCDWTFGYTDASTIVLKTPKTNLRALRCYLKCGFQPYMIGDLDGVTVIWMKKVKNTWQLE